MRPSRGLFAILSLVTAALLTPIGTPAAGASSPRAAASRAPCPGQDNLNAAAAVQKRAMLCLVNRARGSHGLAPLVPASPLARAADRKSADILRCGEFSHQACGHEFTFWISHFGYRGCAEGENIAAGSGSLATPHAIFTAWMQSHDHRANILGDYEVTGLGVRTGTLEGHAGAHIWTQDFGTRSC
jgi:uncharacterized protein YkwD